MVALGLFLIPAAWHACLNAFVIVFREIIFVSSFGDGNK
jgi:hypothetical protein